MNKKFHDLEPVRRIVGDYVRDLRKEKGWNRVQLAAETKLTQQTLLNLEQGMTLPNESTLRLISIALGVEPSVLSEKLVEAFKEIEQKGGIHAYPTVNGIRDARSIGSKS